jgi:quinol monooxygenase YgiN
MSLPVLIGFAGVLVAAVATGMLAGRCVRRPTIACIAWTAATLALTAALAAESKGFASGFSPVTFRAVQLFALLLAPLWMAWGLAERTWPSEAARFGARLACGALTVVGTVILATDPLTAQPFGKSWPSAYQHYQPPSHYALDAAQAVAVAIAVTAVALAAARTRSDRQRRNARAGAAVIALAVLMTVGQRFSLPAKSLYPLLGLAAAGLVWFGATRLESLAGRQGRARAAGRNRRAGLDQAAGRDDAVSQDSRYGQGQPGARADQGRELTDAEFAVNGYQEPDYGGPPPPGDGADAGRWPDPGRRPSPAPPAWPRTEPSAAFPGAVPAAVPVPASAVPASTVPASTAAGFSAHAQPAGSPARPYGRILLFTLLDDRMAAFDQLAEQAAEEVRIREPDTLVYVIHLVPSAPMQRIFYEIYRDRAAFDHHERQPYMQRFVAERRSCVLATNVIELRLKYAKVAPLPNPQPAAEAAAPPGPAAQLPPGPLPPGVRTAQALEPLPPGPDRRMPSAGRRPGGP